MIIGLALLCGFAALGLLSLEVMARRRGNASLARAGSYGVTVPSSPVSERSRHLAQGVASLARIGLRFTPGRDRVKTAAQLHAAGFARGNVEAFVALKLTLAFAGILVGVLIGAGGASVAVAIVLAAMLAAVGFVGPDVVVRRRAQARRERMLTELPNALDLLAVIVEAGLGLDAALTRYGAVGDGPLADEFGSLATELRIAPSRDDAFRRFVERVPAPETKSFVRAVVHADRLGVSLSQTLRTQADEARLRRRAAAEEQANKAPVKMLFPTVFCIFPALFVVVLGPPLLQFAHGL